MDELSTVKYDVADAVATISLNRPDARNALTTQLRADMQQAIYQANSDDDVKVVIISGEGKGFCAGADLAEDMDRGNGAVTRQLRNEYMTWLTAIATSPKPFIAAVDGAAAGIGATLVMTCDLAVMSEESFLYSAFGAISLVPDGGFHWWLSRQIGPKKTYEMILESQRLPAQQCLELGLCNKVVSADALMHETRTWAQKLAKSAPLTARYSKQILAQVPSQSLLDSADLEAQLQNSCIRSDDFLEGVDAFFNKREPSFRGE